MCFYLSCSRIVPKEVLARFAHNLVVHESDLPCGKGWSPLTWQVLAGADRIPITLFEAAEAVDAGPIYLQDVIALDGSELVDELRGKQAKATLDLCRRMVDSYPVVLERARAQSGDGSWYPRRRPADSAFDPTGPVAEQFDLLRVADPDRYPAFFDLRGSRYKLRIEKVEGSTVASPPPAVGVVP